DMFCSFDESCRRHLQRVCKAALGQLDFERIFTLWFGVVQRRLGRVAEARLVYMLANERCFGLGRSPRLGSHAAHCDACPSRFPAGNRDYDGRRRQRELVGRAVAELQIDLPASRDWRWKRDVCDEVAWFEHGFAMRRAAGQKMKVTDGDRARTVGSLYVQRRF